MRTKISWDLTRLNESYVLWHERQKKTNIDTKNGKLKKCSVIEDSNGSIYYKERTGPQTDILFP